MKELVIISGKGGTGKTCLVAAFASIAQKKILCDADVDAADLHLIMDPEVIERGEWFISDTRFGPMVHAHLGIAEENSGKLVTLVRQESKKLAEVKGLDLILTDGPLALVAR